MGRGAVGRICVDRVASVCDDALEALPEGRHREQVAAVRAHLYDPLRVAVAGRIKAGKSTLVNALVGQPIAPTAVEECTKVVTWYAHGVPERAELVLRDGRRDVLALDGGQLPERLGHALEEIDSLRVYLSRESLRRMTLIDTPGLSSVNEQISDRTEALLVDRSSRSASRQADALVFLIGHGANQDDAEALEAFNSLFGGGEASPATSVAILSRADQVGGGEGDPLEAAKAIAAGQATALRSVTATVIPVAGLIAQTVESGALGEREVLALRELAKLDSDTRQWSLFSHEEFLSAKLPVPEQQRRRLLHLLGIYGIARALGFIDAGITSPSQLESELRKLCRIDRLRELLDETFTKRGDALKANAAMTSLTRISWQAASEREAPVLHELRGSVEELRLEPTMRVIGEIWAAQAAAHPDTLLPGPLREDIARIASQDTASAKLGLAEGTAPGALEDAARKASARWHTYHNVDATSEVELRIARIMYRSYDAIIHRAGGGLAA